MGFTLCAACGEGCFGRQIQPSPGGPSRSAAELDLPEAFPPCLLQQAFICCRIISELSFGLSSHRLQSAGWLLAVYYIAGL